MSTGVDYSPYYLQVALSYCIMSTQVLMGYDLLLTFDRELRTIWKRKYSATTLLFLAVRYTALITAILNQVSELFDPAKVSSCQEVLTAYAVFFIANSFATGLFSSLRVWAIWGQSWFALLVILPFSLVPGLLNIYHYSKIRILPTLSSLPKPFGGCEENQGISLSNQQKFAVTTRVCAMVSDVIVLVATWIKTARIRRNLQRLNGEASLSMLLWRDGSIYFGALLTVHVATLVFDETPSVAFNPISPFTTSISSIMICRLMLNLRTYGEPNSDLSASSQTISSVRFAGVVGNIGASVAQNDSTDCAHVTVYDFRRDPLTSTMFDEVQGERARAAERYQQRSLDQSWGTDERSVEMDMFAKVAA